MSKQANERTNRRTDTLRQTERPHVLMDKRTVYCETGNNSRICLVFRLWMEAGSWVT